MSSNELLLWWIFLFSFFFARNNFHFYYLLLKQELLFILFSFAWVFFELSNEKKKNSNRKKNTSFYLLRSGANISIKQMLLLWVFTFCILIPCEWRWMGRKSCLWSNWNEKRKRCPFFFWFPNWLLMLWIVNGCWVFKDIYIYMYEYDVYMYTWIYNLNGMHRT